MFSKSTLALVAAGLAIAAPALAHPNEQGPDGLEGVDAWSNYDYARVTNVEPQLRQVSVSVPRRECYTETGYAPAPGPAAGGERPAAGGMILGGLIGAVIGHQFGHGQQRNAGTVAGAVIGSAIGHDAAQRRAYQQDAYAPQSTGQFERCETRYSERVEERIEGYRVRYRYNDRDYQTMLPYDPGERLRVRVTVSPEG